MATPQEKKAILEALNAIINGMVTRRDKLDVYLDDADTLTAGQKSAINTAINQAKTALDSLNTSIQNLT